MAAGSAVPRSATSRVSGTTRCSLLPLISRRSSAENSLSLSLTRSSISSSKADNATFPLVDDRIGGPAAAAKRGDAAEGGCVRHETAGARIRRHRRHDVTQQLQQQWPWSAVSRTDRRAEMNQMMPAVYSLTEPNIAIGTKTSAHARTQARHSHWEIFVLNTDIQNNILKPMTKLTEKERNVSTTTSRPYCGKRPSGCRLFSYFFCVIAAMFLMNKSCI